MCGLTGNRSTLRPEMQGLGESLALSQLFPASTRSRCRGVFDKQMSVYFSAPSNVPNNGFIIGCGCEAAWADFMDTGNTVAVKIKAVIAKTLMVIFLVS